MTCPKAFFLLLLSLSITTTTAFELTQQRARSPSALGMGKNSYRAHYEHKLEELMDNDWRVFRANLVARESAERDNDKKSDDHEADDEGLRKQRQLTDFFAGAIGAFFRQYQNQHTLTTTSADADDTAASEREFMDGEFIGAAAANAHEYLPDGITEDPFLSLAELPLLLPKTKPIDKHRWAHELAHIEPGCVLIANEKLSGDFHQTVVLITDHSDKRGSTGLVINR
jgi:putative transcriptional regulator